MHLIRGIGSKDYLVNVWNWEFDCIHMDSLPGGQRVFPIACMIDYEDSCSLEGCLNMICGTIGEQISSRTSIIFLLLPSHWMRVTLAASRQSESAPTTGRGTSSPLTFVRKLRSLHRMLNRAWLQWCVLSSCSGLEHVECHEVFMLTSHRDGHANIKCSHVRFCVQFLLWLEFQGRCWKISATLISVKFSGAA